jgi:hypothetical protein
VCQTEQTITVSNVIVARDELFALEQNGDLVVVRSITDADYRQADHNQEEAV